MTARVVPEHIQSKGFVSRRCVASRFNQLSTTATRRGWLACHASTRTVLY
jgi:hypothetical protein